VVIGVQTSESGCGLLKRNLTSQSRTALRTKAHGGPSTAELQDPKLAGLHPNT
jgi:hypothetical protein